MPFGSKSSELNVKVLKYGCNLKRFAYWGLLLNPVGLVVYHSTIIEPLRIELIFISLELIWNFSNIWFLYHC